MPRPNMIDVCVYAGHDGVWLNRLFCEEAELESLLRELKIASPTATLVVGCEAQSGQESEDREATEKAERIVALAAKIGLPRSTFHTAG